MWTAGDAGQISGNDEAVHEGPTDLPYRNRWSGDVTDRPEPRQSRFEQLSRLIALIDRQIAGVLDNILHHPEFQALEASWRSLRGLVESVPPDSGVVVRVLNVSWKELARDFDRSPEFDASQLFRKVYSEAFGTAGGYPFGLLVGDYEIRPWPSAEHPISDLAVLTGVSEVAAAAFAAFVTGAHPTLLGIDEWSQLERPINLQRVYEQPEFLKWRSFREAEERQFAGLVVPPRLVRLPYTEHSPEVVGLCYREDVRGRTPARYLWGNPAYDFARVVVRSFAETRWLASIRGVSKHVSAAGIPEGIAESGGLVTGLPFNYTDADPYQLSPVSPTIVTITDELEYQLSDLGFIPMATCQNSEFAAFYSNRSVRQVPTMETTSATENATVAAQLQYVLCTSRFAHFLKIIARDLIGSYTDASSLERFLNAWLQSYVAMDPDASPAVRARYPLRQAAVVVREIPGRPGAYTSIVQLLPHCELDELRGAVTFRSELLAGLQ